jgi:ankyrin repeat protein
MQGKNNATLFSAIYESNEEALLTSLKKSDLDLEQRDQHGNTPLLLALKMGNLLFAQILFDNGASLSSTSRVF